MKILAAATWNATPCAAASAKCYPAKRRKVTRIRAAGDAKCEMRRLVRRVFAVIFARAQPMAGTTVLAAATVLLAVATVLLAVAWGSVAWGSVAWA